MTTIAYRGGILAADTAMVQGDAIVGETTKISRTANGDLVSACGNADFALAFRTWALGGEAGDPPKAEYHRDDNVLDRGAIFRRDGRIEIFEPGGRLDVRAPYYAMGSGSPEARGAMHAGADPIGAVRAAMDHDAHTGGSVEYLDAEKEGGPWVAVRPTIIPWT